MMNFPGKEKEREKWDKTKAKRSPKHFYPLYILKAEIAIFF